LNLQDPGHRSTSAGTKSRSYQARQVTGHQPEDIGGQANTSAPVSREVSRRGPVTSSYDAAAELTALAASIDAQLADETASRQHIAESASARIKDITLQMLGAALATRATGTGCGPFETEQDVRELPAVRAIYDAMHASRRPPHHRSIGDERNHRLLCEKLTAAGVELGAYDHQIVAWLAGWEPQTCAVVAGWVTRGP
jgi:hypothetical protein